MPITPANAGIVRINRAVQTQIQIDSERRQKRREENAQKALKSRCCSTPSERNLWHCYWYTEHDDVVRLAHWIHSLGDSQKESVLGEIYALLEDAAAGKLHPKDRGEPIKIIDQADDFYEIRRDLSRFWNKPALLRQYHAEPQEEDFDNLLVTSHIHFKEVQSELSKDEINQLQTKAMQQAVHRYNAGKPSEWGLKKPDAELINPYNLLLDLLDSFM